MQSINYTALYADIWNQGPQYTTTKYKYMIAPSIWLDISVAFSNFITEIKFTDARKSKATTAEWKWDWNQNITPFVNWNDGVEKLKHNSIPTIGTSRLCYGKHYSVLNPDYEEGDDTKHAFLSATMLRHNGKTYFLNNGSWSQIGSPNLPMTYMELYDLVMTTQCTQPLITGMDFKIKGLSGHYAAKEAFLSFLSNVLHGLIVRTGFWTMGIVHMLEMERSAIDQEKDKVTFPRIDYELVLKTNPQSRYSVLLDNKGVVHAVVSRDNTNVKYKMGILLDSIIDSDGREYKLTANETKFLKQFEFNAEVME